MGDGLNFLLFEGASSHCSPNCIGLLTVVAVNDTVDVAVVLIGAMALFGFAIFKGASSSELKRSMIALGPILAIRRVGSQESLQVLCVDCRSSRVEVKLHWGISCLFMYQLGCA